MAERLFGVEPKSSFVIRSFSKFLLKFLQSGPQPRRASGLRICSASANEKSRLESRLLVGGEGGIRTLGPLARPTH